MLATQLKSTNRSRLSGSFANLLAGCVFLFFAFCASQNLSAATSGATKKGGDVSIPSQVETINASIAAIWKDYSLKPSPMEDDLKWCRRVFLNILGRIPSFVEIQEFAKDKSPNRKQLLVERLLNDDRYTEEYAANWSTIWTNILIGRNGGMEDRSLTNRDGMLKYLRDCFARNRPYNDMVYELVTATGSTKPGTENFNGATNFLAMKVNEEDGVQATSAVSRTFLGLQVQCTQCHNHPFNEWKQQKFWEFNAFFRQTKSLRRFIAGTRDIEHAELVDEDYSGESRRPDKADLFYQLRNGVTKVAYPVFVDGTAIDKSGYLQQVNRRQELGKLMMQSPYLDKMIVNRMWAHFMSYGFTRPIDDLGPHNPSSNLELLEELGEEFRNSSYDLKQLMTWIVLSDAYQRSSRITADNVTDDPAVGEPPRFTHFYSKQMRAEELYQSLVVATQADRKGSLEEQEQRRSNWLRQFIVAFGTDEGDETSTFNGSIPQSLMMFNGELMKEATSLEAGSWLQRISTTASPASDKVQYLFAAGLARKAKPEELNIAKSLLDARKNDTAAMLQDLWWAILNSNEFIINH